MIRGQLLRCMRTLLPIASAENACAIHASLLCVEIDLQGTCVMVFGQIQKVSIPLNKSKNISFFSCCYLTSFLLQGNEVTEGGTGRVQLVIRDFKEDKLRAVSDPRKDGAPYGL